MLTGARREAFRVSDRLHCNSEESVMQVVSARVTAQQLRRYRQRIPSRLRSLKVKLAFPQ